MYPIGTLIVWTLALSLAAFSNASPDPAAAELKTSKERLSNKATDEQRVDNCRVPLDQRGPAPRPDCGGEAEASRRAPDGPRNAGAGPTKP